MQEVDFPVRLIVADDCSPDGTEALVRNIIATHPKGHWIDYMRHDTNKGMMPNFTFALQRATEKYIALCDGDDYWTDSLKLQKQVDFLEQNEECVLTHSSFMKRFKDDSLCEVDFELKEVQNREEIIKNTLVKTCTVLFRNHLLSKQEISHLFNFKIGDLPLFLFLANYGKFHYKNQIDTVYRVNVGHNAMENIQNDLSFVFYDVYARMYDFSDDNRVKYLYLLNILSNLRSLILAKKENLPNKGVKYILYRIKQVRHNSISIFSPVEILFLMKLFKKRIV
jgi:glycosyltransferase involved in cell wall biosynthesis